jgi:Zonular occludens toxin (Zot)
MAVYSVEGKLGTGKTKFAVWQAQLALLEGRRVASNVDLKPHILTPRKRSSYVRIPDKPSAFDLEAMGHGNPDSYDESRNGVLILDELGTWLNSRSYQDKTRADLLDWLIHARKHGWDVYLIIQHSGMIDKQVREGLIEYTANCMRMDKVKIPFIGGFLSNIYKPLGYLPKFHLVTARVGTPPVVAERWSYVGKHLHAAYDTRQVFTSNYPHGPHSVLPPWDFKPSLGWARRLRRVFASVFATIPKPEHRPPLPVVQLLRKLPPHEAEKWAVRYWQQIRNNRPFAMRRGAW